MLVKTVIIHIYIPLARSLKNKRNIVKSITQKVHNKYNVSIAEVGHNEIWKNAAIGIAMISNERLHLEKKFSDVVRFIEETYSDIEIIRIEDY
jgi:hypothetical protein